MLNSWITAHGITDLVDSPGRSIIVYSLVTPIVLKCSVKTRAALLVAGSIYHMRQDVPGSVLGSIVMHGIWLKWHSVAPLFLGIVHVSRHYHRVMGTRTIPKIVAVLYMMLSTAILQTTVSKWPTLWWVGPVLSHIIVNDLVNLTRLDFGRDDINRIFSNQNKLFGHLVYL